MAEVKRVLKPGSICFWHPRSRVALAWQRLGGSGNLFRRWGTSRAYGWVEKTIKASDAKMVRSSRKLFKLYKFFLSSVLCQKAHRLVYFVPCQSLMAIHWIRAVEVRLWYNVGRNCFSISGCSFVCHRNCLKKSYFEHFEPVCIPCSPSSNGVGRSKVTKVNWPCFSVSAIFPDTREVPGIERIGRITSSLHGIIDSCDNCFNVSLTTKFSTKRPLVLIIDTFSGSLIQWSTAFEKTASNCSVKCKFFHLQLQSLDEDSSYGLARSWLRHCQCQELQLHCDLVSQMTRSTTQIKNAFSTSRSCNSSKSAPNLRQGMFTIIKFCIHWFWIVFFCACSLAIHTYKFIVIAPRYYSAPQLTECDHLLL